MKRFDRIVTGVVLMIAGSVGVFWGARLLLLVGEAEAVERNRPSRTGSEFSRDAFVQGNWIAIPDRQEFVVCPVVQTDGRLEPQFKYPVDLGPKEGASFFLAKTLLLPSRRAEPVRMDYRFERTESMPTVPRESWVLSTELGLMKTDSRHQVEGWLTDQGWSKEPRVCESYRSALLLPLSLQSQHAPYFRYGHTQDPVVVYLTPDALYRADLRARRIERVSPVAAPTGVFLGTGPRSSFPRSFVLTSKRIYWIDPVSSGGFGSVELPERLWAKENLEVASGTEGRVIFREELAGTRENGAVPYRVLVLTPEGAIDHEYEYSFPRARNRPGELRGVEPQVTGEDILQKTTGGALSQVLMPPAWKMVIGASIRPAARWRWGTLALYVDPRVGEGPLWLHLPLPLVLAFWVGRREWRPSRGWLAPSRWVAFVLGFGVAAALVYWLLGGRTPSRRKGDQKPRILGIEILRPVGDYSPK